MRRKPVIAIDGPPGSGKTTVSEAVARELGYKRIDTGAMYRASAVVAKSEGIDFSSGEAIADRIRSLSMDFVIYRGTQKILVNGEDFEDRIRSEEVGMWASDISKDLAVRETLVEKQRIMGASGGVVCEGRDSTTVIFPDAELRFFLDASAHKRAERRYLELVAAGKNPQFKNVFDEMIRRDIQDCTRDNSPLRLAHGVNYVDTTSRTPEEVARIILEEVKKGEWENTRRREENNRGK